MVRGRRGRPTTKIEAALLANGVQVTSLIDDPHCASPKRKDCKIDTSIEKNLKAVVSSMKHAPVAAISPRCFSREKRTAAAAATVYMRECLEAGNHSKNRSQNHIKNYFKSNSKGELYDIPNNTEGAVIQHNSQQDDHQLIAALSFDLSEEDTCNEIFGKYDVQKPQTPPPQVNSYHHRLRSSPINGSQNIFLQEPVLSLNVDKSPNQASSIKIKKTLEVEPVFSSPPMTAASMANSNYPTCLNGQFNKIVSLNTSPKRENSLESTASTFASSNSSSSNSNCYLLNIDSSSCDSGVVFIDNKTEISPSRRRKPATPHRIVCPSPIKSCCVSRSGVAVLPNTGVSPSKKTLISATTSSLPPYQHSAQRRHPKSRRRLNQQEHENKCVLPSGQPPMNEDSSAVDAVQSQLEYNSHNKSILNSAKNPTAEQNTNNNNYKKKQNVALTSNSKIKLQAANANPVGNRELTEFFPVRRSVRKTKTAVKEEMMKSLEKAILEERADGLKIENFEGKGRGICADRPFQRGEFVVEYIGDLIDMTEANVRERKYALDENAGCYMYYFKHKNQQYCIDATAESGKLGRLVNHSRNGNLITKVVVVKNRPHLVLIAKDDIEPGEELTYDYGDRSKEALLHHPWLAF
ncbi:histone-lysine N-methyltransferase PR-Set7 isoform X2 [Episyrphus balteatus]|uniref:histone-lysine N-methyltransferase PR-Set7 isoform X2 n=1 Tax=Episyrphus balteatus TaxID=286459 RepID=UPI00248692BB|nr:histone-lysine N-methyltransferase PR-Set7 isoform X2 [Episyrphus balteatus]